MMQVMSVIGGAISSAIGGFKLLNDHNETDLMDVKYHDLTDRQIKIYNSQVSLANDKRVLALNSLTENYGNAGFSTSGGLGAQEAQAVHTSFNNQINELGTRFEANMQNLDYENQLAHQTQDLKYLSDFASIGEGITNYAKMYNDYTGKGSDYSATGQSAPQLGQTSSSNTYKPPVFNSNPPTSNTIVPQASIASNYINNKGRDTFDTMSDILVGNIMKLNEKYGLTNTLKNFILR